ncbi:DNA cytosine methyltransferase [Jatrophihabitans sp.]|uniref:DNA cytosine methyltransferase n=1 Tax=Jatrophihabitans sp. TaxID=1932789 RepID=UPI002B99086F|nr:DNA cytosine methyltransferase [Jatrophihabitans sp.]
MTNSIARLPELDVAVVESYRVSGTMIERSVRLRSGAVVCTQEQARPSAPQDAPANRFVDAWLRRETAPTVVAEPLTIADLFSGCGGLSLGAQEAARAVGRRAVHVLAVDNNQSALGVYSANFPEAQTNDGDINGLVDGALGARPTRLEKRLQDQLAGLDLAIGGPPCQGHSDLNNHTRREDPKNQLYLRMVRFVEVVRPKRVLIENVPGVAYDRSGVTAVAEQVLRGLGYTVDTGVVRASDVGAAQARRRHLLLATRGEQGVSIGDIAMGFGAPPRPVLDAIDDLDVEPNRGVFGSPATHSRTNQNRIQYLFDHGLYELPDEQRPECHRLKKHSYRAVYGRMYPDRPAPTITAGFGSTGQGRFVHPLRPRTLTPHEAARLQGFPDWFSFETVEGRRALQEMIGNAVPTRLAYAAIVSLLR